MEPVFEKLKDMLNAYYPTFYLQSYEYNRTWMKIQSISKSFIAKGIDVHLFRWNCVEGLLELKVDGNMPIKVDGEDVVEPAMVLKYIYGITDKKHKDIFVL